MVTQITNFDSQLTFYGLSSDTKPTNVPNSSVFYEMDQGEVYLYDAENGQWINQ